MQPALRLHRNVLLLALRTPVCAAGAHGTHGRWASPRRPVVRASGGGCSVATFCGLQRTGGAAGPPQLAAQSLHAAHDAAAAPVRRSMVAV